MVMVPGIPNGNTARIPLGRWGGAWHPTTELSLEPGAGRFGGQGVNSRWHREGTGKAHLVFIQEVYCAEHRASTMAILISHWRVNINGLSGDTSKI